MIPMLAAVCASAATALRRADCAARLLLTRPCPRGLQRDEIFHRDHLRARCGGIAGDLAGKVERQLPVDLPSLDAHAVR